ncbi:MAG TPA: cyclopropane-fatty-acyl-phospholipid synthase family protein [Caulobacteraceae bacterium]|nr:cyclopropane-fatty-acyl-phospholipid synthase family protein [Caulobacteraceae bacterium]
MSLTALATRAAERASLPDVLTRAGVGYLVARARRRLDAEPLCARAFAKTMDAAPIARATDAANEQHYEVPAAFFERVLGPRLKYSSCLYRTGTESLAEAETLALAETCAHAGLADGQEILELGCGWGSLSLFMAQRYPAARITAVSNSSSQRRFIEARAASCGLANLRVETCDMNDFEPQGRFDRVVSVEMFEHMANWRALLTRLRPALKNDGRLFLHVFTHRDRPYSFDDADPDDFIARHFFTGGIMPSHDLIGAFADLFEVEADWRWSGRHYQRTALDWLDRFDRQAPQIEAIFRETYGAQASLWMRRWRLFFLAVAGLFGDRGGEVWGVSHYRLKPA